MTGGSVAARRSLVYVVGRGVTYSGSQVATRSAGGGLKAFAANVVPGGPGKDGIPAIDRPRFMVPRARSCSPTTTWSAVLAVPACVRDPAGRTRLEREAPGWPRATHRSGPTCDRAGACLVAGLGGEAGDVEDGDFAPAQVDQATVSELPEGFGGGCAAGTREGGELLMGQGNMDSGAP